MLKTFTNLFTRSADAPQGEALNAVIPQAPQEVATNSYSAKVNQFAKATLQWGTWAAELSVNGVMGAVPVLQVIPPVCQGTKKAAQYASAVIDKKNGRFESELADPKKHIQKQLVRLETGHSKECAELGNWLGDTVAKLAIDKASNNTLVAMLIGFLGKELTFGTIKVNLLNIIANGMDLPEGNLAAVEAPVVAAPAVELPPGEAPAVVLPPVVAPEEELEDLIPDLGGNNAPDLDLNLNAEIDNLLDGHVAIPAPAVEPNLAAPALANPFQLLINKLKEIVSLYPGGDLDEINERKKDAQLELEQAKARLSFLEEMQDDSSVLAKQLSESRAKKAFKSEARAALINRKALEEEYLKNALLAEVKLEVMDILEQNDPFAIEQFKAKAKASIEKAQQKLDEQLEQIKVQEKLIKEKVAPAVLNFLFPKGAESLLIYHPYIVVGPIQSLAWNIIQAKVPELLSKLLPLLLLTDLPAQKAKLEAKPYAPLGEQGIDLLFNDGIKIAFNKLKIPVEHQIMLAEFVKPYIDYLGFNLVNTLAQLDQDTFVRMIEILGEARSKLSAAADEKEEAGIICNALLECYYLLPLEAQKEFLGLPQIITEPLLKAFFVKLTVSIVKYVLPPLKFLKQQKVVVLPEDAIGGTTLKVSDMAEAFTWFANFQSSKLLDNKVITDTGYSKVVNQIIDLSKELGKKLQEKDFGYAFVGFLGDLLENGTFSSLIDGSIGVINSEPVRPLKYELIELLKPLLVNTAVKGLDPLLEKERLGGRQFDLELMTAALPVLIRHLKERVNQPAMLKLDRKASPEEVHRKLCNKISRNTGRVREEVVYKRYVNKILNLFVPNGQASLGELFPYLSEKDQASAWDLTNKIPSLLSPLKNKAFSEEIFKMITTAIYEGAIEAFQEGPKPKKAADVNPRPQAPVVELTPEELAFQKQVDQDLEALLYEAARFTDLPVDRLLNVARRLPGHGAVKGKVIEAIRKAIYKQADGHLLEKALKKGLTSQVNKVDAPKPAKPPKPANYLDTLERNVVKQGILFGLKSAADAVKDALKALDYPVSKQVKDAVVALTTFILVRIIGGFLRYTGLDERFIDKIYALLKRNREKIQAEFAKPEKNIGVVLDTVEALEQVLVKNWGPAPVPV